VFAPSTEVNPDKILPSEIENLNKIPASERKVLAVPVPSVGNSHKMELKELVTTNNLQFKSGINYYQLVKPEKIKSHKDLLVMDESGNIFGKGNSGEEIRRALGIPTSGDILVHPKKGKYKIFVQSDSHNRKMLSWKDKTTGKFIQQELIVLL